jgi:hypothetical protein
MVVRRVTVGTLSGTVCILVALVAIALFVQFPMVMTTGDARLQRWIGPDAARLSFLALAVAVGVGAIWVAIRGTHDPATRPAWLLGAVGGAGVGLVAALVYLITAGVTSSSAGLQLAPELVSIALLLGPLVIGLVAGRTQGTTSAGAVAGFWFALPLALLADVGVLASDSLFSSRLVQTAWANYSSGDALCSGAHGATLLGCAVGDDLGFAATLLILGPVLGLSLGAVAGLFGRGLSRRQDKARASWAAAVVPLVIFSALLAAVMIAELVGNLW